MMFDRLPDWLAYCLCDLAALVDRRVWDCWTLEMQHPPWHVARVDAEKAAWLILHGWKWDGWLPSRYV